MIHVVLPVDLEPEITLYRWQIYKVKSKNWPEETYHFVGNCGEGRVSSAIVSFDKEKMLGVTESGRVYKLSGHSIANMDANYVFGRWKEICNVYQAEDVSNNLLKI